MAKPGDVVEICDEYMRAVKLLPAWFIPRMMQDDWYFALIMVNGDAVHCSRICDVSLAANGEIWLDVELLRDVPHLAIDERRNVFALTTRCYASLNAAHVMVALETADT